MVKYILIKVFPVTLPAAVCEIFSFFFTVLSRIGYFVVVFTMIVIYIYIYICICIYIYKVNYFFPTFLQ